MINVHEHMTDQLASRLDAFLARAEAATGACGEHDPRWIRILQHALGHQPHLLIATDDNNPAQQNPSQSQPEIIGYLPLVLVASRLFGRFLVSLPYINRAGVVARDARTAHQLIEHAAQLARSLNAGYLELRHHGQAIQHPQLTFARDEKHRMVLQLPPSTNELWDSLKAKVRNQIRKGDKSELSIRWGVGPHAPRELNDFYNVFAVNMRDLGTPVFAKTLFADILKHFGQRAELAVVDHQGQPIAAALLVHDPPQADRPASTQVPSASTLRAFNHTNANMWMYHHLLCRAIQRNHTPPTTDAPASADPTPANPAPTNPESAPAACEFDFGRSSEDSGTYRFKKQWGAQPKPTVWQYCLLKGDVNQMRPDSPKNRKRVETWKKLPVWLTRLIGPPIVRGIP